MRVVRGDGFPAARSVEQLPRATPRGGRERRDHDKEGLETSRMDTDDLTYVAVLLKDKKQRSLAQDCKKAVLHII